MNRSQIFTKISCDWSSIVIWLVIVSLTTSHRESYKCSRLVVITLRPMPTDADLCRSFYESLRLVLWLLMISLWLLYDYLRLVMIGWWSLPITWLQHLYTESGHATVSDITDSKRITCYIYYIYISSRWVLRRIRSRSLRKARPT